MKDQSEKKCIDIVRKETCYGCGACVSACPQSCIIMTRDEEGFDYPLVDSARCTHCGKCLDVCPFVDLPDSTEHRLRPLAYASWNMDENVRQASSSGGVFSALAEYVLSKGGRVFGAAFQDSFTRVRHIGVATCEGLIQLRGSKYVQSSTTDAFNRVRQELLSGRRVLFSGTPCQVAGLRKLLGPNTAGLLTCDLVCHGVPSPGIFAKYMEEQCCSVRAPTVAYCFRDKGTGWNTPSVRQLFDNGRVYTRWNWGDSFMYGFLINVFLRPACYKCPFVGMPRVADITLADYWGVATKYPQYDDNRGTSLVLVNTASGDALFDACRDRLFAARCDLDHAVSHSSHLVKAARVPACRQAFFDANSRMTFNSAARVYVRMRTLWKRRSTRAAKRVLWLVRSSIRRLGLISGPVCLSIHICIGPNY